MYLRYPYPSFKIARSLAVSRAGVVAAFLAASSYILFTANLEPARSVVLPSKPTAAPPKPLAIELVAIGVNCPIDLTTWVKKPPTVGSFKKLSNGWI